MAASAEAVEISAAEAQAAAGDMKPRTFLDQLDDVRVIAAIQEAERTTSGEIRVFVSARKLRGDDIIARAGRRFEKLGMTATRERNGVLLFFMPRERKFAVIGDIAIHEKCGSPFWEEIASGLRERLARGDFTEAVVQAVARAGKALAEHFPRNGDDHNELPDEIGRES